MAVVQEIKTKRICDFCKSSDREGHPYAVSAPLDHYEFDVCDQCRTTVTLAEVLRRIEAKPFGVLKGNERLPYMRERGNEVAAGNARRAELDRN